MLDHVEISKASPPCEIPSGRKSHPFEYILEMTEHCYAFVGLGALTPGYIIIAPIKWFHNIGELPDEVYDDFTELKSRIGSHLQRLYKDVIFFEHGSSNSCKATGACIDHAHLHCIPSNGHVFKDYMPPAVRVLEINELPRDDKMFIEDGYLYLEEKGKKYLVSSDQHIPSQFFRRIWATTLGIDEILYDWAINPESEHMKLTYENFLRDREH